MRSLWKYVQFVRLKHRTSLVQKQNKSVVLFSWFRWSFISYKMHDRWPLSNHQRTVVRQAVVGRNVAAVFRSWAVKTDDAKIGQNEIQFTFASITTAVDWMAAATRMTASATVQLLHGQLIQLWLILHRWQILGQWWHDRYYSGDRYYSNDRYYSGHRHYSDDGYNSE